MGHVSQTRSGYRSSANGLVGALIVILLLMGVMAVMIAIQNNRHIDSTPATVDYADTLGQARSQSPFPVLAPASLPTGWHATSVSWSGAGPEKSWHLGMLTNDDQYVGLEQGNQVAHEFIADKTPADEPGPPVEIDGATWQTLTHGDETALVLSTNDVTTVVTGTAPESTLVSFVKSLTTS